MTIRIREQEVEGRPVDYEHVCETTLQQVSESLEAIRQAKQEAVWNWQGAVSAESEGEISANHDGIAISLIIEGEQETDERWIIVTASGKLEVFRVVGDDDELGGLDEIGHVSLADCDELGRIRGVVQGAHRDIVGAQSLMEF